jgi:micrococcal nuclease
MLNRINNPKLLLIISVLSIGLSTYITYEFFNFKDTVIKDLNLLNENSIKIQKNEFTTSVSLESIPYNTLIKVTKVIDGDTVELEGGERLRYIGVDTPEMNFGKELGSECYAKEATKKNEELVLNKKIKFINDKNVRDKYGRLLGYVYLENGLFVNEILVKQGFAKSYPYKPDISKQNIFEEAEKVAKNSNLGLWSNCFKKENNEN